MDEIHTVLRRIDCRLRQSRRRLAIALAISTVVVVVSLALLPVFLSYDSDVVPPDELEVNLLNRPQPVAPEPDAVEPPEQEKPDAEPAEPVETDSLAAATDDDTPAEVIEPAMPKIDWIAALQDTASRSDEFEQKTPSMSPRFDELRRIAAVRYAKPNTRARKPIWENVEKDMLGRTILRHGDCYRVLDDPSVMNQWVQENFTQYLTFCSKLSRAPRLLPWVEEIVARYDYLQDRDFVPYPPTDQASAAYVAKTSVSVIEENSPEDPQADGL